jgi:hypothetical protein
MLEHEIGLLNIHDDSSGDENKVPVRKKNVDKTIESTPQCVS